MGFDVLLLGYISIKRGGATHVVHADRAACVCVCETELCMGDWNRCFLEVGHG